MEATELIQTQDGSHSLLSHQYGVPYHSKYGAIQESTHVFIDAGLNPFLLKQKEEIRILEFGFGTGLNAYLSALSANKNEQQMFYEGIEAYPVPYSTAERLNYPEQLQEPKADFLALHQSSWDELHTLSPYFKYFKRLGKFEDQSYTPQFNVIFFDAFAPTAQPTLWELPLLELAYEALLPGGTLVTYCAKGAVKRALKSLGFQVEALPGPPGKREMTRAIK